MTGLSVSKMFMAGMIPGILMGVGMIGVAYVISKKRQYPKRDKRASLGEILREGRDSIFALLMVVIILGTIWGGICTPTEASVLAVIYGALVGMFVYRTLDLKGLVKCMKDCVISSSAIMVLVGLANVFAYILTKEKIPQMVANAMLSMTTNKYIILILINLLLLFVGMFMETIAAILILFPVLLGVVTTVGVDPMQFGVLCVLNLVIGLCTPPVGVCLFAATNIGETKLTGVIRELVPFVVSNIIVLLLVSFVPAITVGFSNLVMGAG